MQTDRGWRRAVLGLWSGLLSAGLFSLLLNYVTPTSIFYAAALPMLIAAILIAFLGVRYGTRVVAPEPALAE